MFFFKYFVTSCFIEVAMIYIARDVLWKLINVRQLIKLKLEFSNLALDK